MPYSSSPLQLKDLQGKEILTSSYLNSLGQDLGQIDSLAITGFYVLYKEFCVRLLSITFIKLCCLLHILFRFFLLIYSGLVLMFSVNFFWSKCFEMLYFFQLCFLESCLWFPVRYGSLLSLWEHIFSVWLLPFITWCFRFLRWKRGKAGATTFGITVLKVSPCKHQLTTAKVLEQILLPRQARRAELFPKDWVLPVFWMSVNSNIGKSLVLYPQSIKSTALLPHPIP